MNWLGASKNEFIASYLNNPIDIFIMSVIYPIFEGHIMFRTCIYAAIVIALVYFINQINYYRRVSTNPWCLYTIYLPTINKFKKVIYIKA